MRSGTFFIGSGYLPIGGFHSFDFADIAVASKRRTASMMLQHNNMI